MNLFTRSVEKRAGRVYRVDGQDSLLAIDRVSDKIITDDRVMAATAVISTPLIDRDGDVVLQEGLDFTNYRRNPVVFFNHQAWPVPIGKSEDQQGRSTIIVTPEQTTATCYFSSKSKESEQIYHLVADGTLRSTSIGFLVKRATPLTSSPMLGMGRMSQTGKPGGYRIENAEVTEWSWVGIGANPEAVLVHLSKGMIAGSQIDDRLRMALQPYAAMKKVMVQSGWDNGMMPDVLVGVGKGFDESRHPRGGDPDNAGRFSTSGGSSSGNNNSGNRSNDSGQGSGSSDKPKEGKLPNSRGVGGSGDGLESQGSKGSLADDEPLEGLPRKIKIEGLGVITAGPLPLARQVAAKYMADAGLPYNPPKKYAKVNTERAAKVATAFDEMEHAPNDPEVKKSYDAMVKETMAQWKAIKESGLECEFIKSGDSDPYEASPRMATEDVRNNNHLWVFPTDSGFGSDPRFDPNDNPMLKDSGEVINGHKAVYNDIFRIVHDYFGHIKEGSGFRADGEENAWRSHSAMYSPLARRAMTAETRGQNSWVNYGPHGEQNRKALAKDTIFADQKVGLLPKWVTDDGAGDDGVETPTPAVKKYLEWDLPKAKMLERFGASLKSFMPEYDEYVVKEFREEDHPRNPSGAEHGGQFTAKPESKKPEMTPEEEEAHFSQFYKPVRNATMRQAVEKPSQRQYHHAGPEEAHQLHPNLNMSAKLSKAELAEVNSKGPAAILAETKDMNAQKQLDGLDKIREKHPEPWKDIASWNAFQAAAYKNKTVPIPPFNFLKKLSDGTLADQLVKLGPGQLKDADHGFKNAKEFRDLYISGEVGVTTTAKLFLWSILSRGVSPYVQESLFIDAYAGAEKWINKAANGELTEDDIFGPKILDENGEVVMVPKMHQGKIMKDKKTGEPIMEPKRGPSAYEEWVKTVAPAQQGIPGAGSTHNLGAFGRNFLWKLSQKDENGVSHLQKLHDMMCDPNQTGRGIRREFSKFGEGCGIDNKVVSFTLLVAGFDDVMVLDRVQMRNLWDDGRFKDYNLYDGISDVKNSALNRLGEGVRGIMYYEAIEDALKERLAEISKKVGRDISIGRYHWESWVSASEQEASHGTLDAILKDAKGQDNVLAGVQAKQGEYAAYQYGARYGRDEKGERYIEWTCPAGVEDAPKSIKFSIPEFKMFSEYLGGTRNKTSVVPKGFSVSNPPPEHKDKPWYERPQINKQRLIEEAQRYAAGEGGKKKQGGRASDENPSRKKGSSDGSRANEGWPWLRGGFTGRFRVIKRCWDGYEPVPGKKPYSEDSCRPKDAGMNINDEIEKAGLQDCVSAKMPKLINEGYEPDQAAAIAYDMCRRGKAELDESTIEEKAVSMASADALVPFPSQDDEETKSMNTMGNAQGNKPMPPGMAYAQAAKELMEAAYEMQENPSVKEYMMRQYGDLKRMCSKAYPECDLEWKLEVPEDDGKPMESDDYEMKGEDGENDGDEGMKPMKPMKPKKEDDEDEMDDEEDDEEEMDDEEDKAYKSLLDSLNKLVVNFSGMQKEFDRMTGKVK